GRRRGQRRTGKGRDFSLIPQFVDDASADIATVFHWTPNAFDEMTIVELGQWREKARLRSGVES
ncbi:GpE family phage tail protein, partial [Mannheimia haemolytica]|uniref:GpE family phage tail protein n=1 Tax=Mannheimia haemolytica TaxID=75985 RepID=UPI003B52B5B1